VATALGLGATSTATWFLVTVSTRVQRRFRDKVTIALESHVARLQAEIATIAHQERPEHLDRLSVLRNQVFVLDHMYMSLFTTCGWILRLAVVIALLMSIHPALLALALFALPTVFTSTWRPGIERAAEERRASSARLAQHLFTVATTAPPGKDARSPASAGGSSSGGAWEWWRARGGSGEGPLAHGLGFRRLRAVVCVVGAAGDAMTCSWCRRRRYSPPTSV
jgi:ATP-binding cassette subfamily B protein